MDSGAGWNPVEACWPRNLALRSFRWAALRGAAAFGGNFEEASPVASGCWLARRVARLRMGSATLAQSFC